MYQTSVLQNSWNDTLNLSVSAILKEVENIFMKNTNDVINLCVEFSH
jgi:hypothetical protein